MAGGDTLSSAVVQTEASKLLLKSGKNKEYNVVVPPASLNIREIQTQIPAKYFERNTWRSLYYLARDITQVILTFTFMYSVIVPFLQTVDAALLPPQKQQQEEENNNNNITLGFIISFLLKSTCWSLFWFVQGLNGTALWVLAHECGHQAFSVHKTLNDIIGMCLHSSLLVPYHSWRITHGGHHKHTNHLTKDLVFIPRKEHKIITLTEEAPLVMLFRLLKMFLLGWPGHLLINAGGQEFGRRANHFEPTAPFFRREDYNDIIISDIGIASVLLVIIAGIYRFGFINVLCYYLIPYLWVNFWLVYITFMQHSDIRIPHYAHEQWTFPRGAIAAVDRNYGFLLNNWLHHINDSHVVHHLFSMMPHYHAIEVTKKYIREILGEVYVTDEMPLIKSLIHTWRECRYVVPSDGICVYRK